MSNKKYVSLTLNEKMKVIEASEKDKLTVREIMLRFKCGKTQIYDTLKNKDKIREEWMKGNGQMKRKAKKTGNEEINGIVWEWFVSARAKNLPLSGPMVQSEALKVAKELGNMEFKASTGWLDSFKARHNIVWNEVCGEAKDVQESVVTEWKPKLRNLIEGYDPKNVFNADETGLFYRALPSKSLAIRGEKCIGGKMSKERLTVLLCGNMLGEMEKPLVIGKAAKPRCFKNMDISKLPVTWRSNKKAWMTSGLMEEWLGSFNAKMRKETRQVLLFLDNATCHPNINLSNVKLAWFPPCSTSITQPMDQGVIYTFKSHYRRLLMQSLILNVQQAESTFALARSISVLDAVNWIGLAVKEIKPETVSKCFNKAGFRDDEEDAPVFIEAEENVAAIAELNKMRSISCSPDDYIRSDDLLSTHSTFTSATDLIENRNTDEDEEETKDEEEEQNEDVPRKINTHEEAIACISDVMQFATHTNNPKLLELLYSAKKSLEQKIVNRKCKQVSLLDMWRKK